MVAALSRRTLFLIEPFFVGSQEVNAGRRASRILFVALIAQVDVFEGIDVLGFVDFNFDSKAASIASGSLCIHDST